MILKGFSTNINFEIPCYLIKNIFSLKQIQDRKAYIQERIKKLNIPAEAYMPIPISKPKHESNQQQIFVRNKLNSFFFIIINK